MFDRLNGFTKGTFLGLEKLTSLDLTGCQRLCSSDLITALSDKTVLPILQELILKKVGTIGFNEIEVNQTLVDILGNRPIEILDFSYSNINFVQPNLNSICGTLTSVNLSYSSFGMRNSLNTSNVCKSLQVLDLSGAHFAKAGIQPLDLNATNESLSLDRSGQFYLNVNNIYINHLLSKRMRLSLQNCSLSVSKNNIMNLEICGYSFINFDVELQFTENRLRRIALADDSMENIGINTFQHLTLLSEIDFSNNKLSRSNNFDRTFQQLFRRNSLLKKMYLSNNGLTYLPFDTFKSNRLLALLDLSGNELKQITFDISTFLNLKVLDMHNNAIIAFNGSSRNALDTLYRKQQTAKVNKTFEVDLRGNHFSCDCDSLEFVEWFVSSPLFTNKDNYTCQANGLSYSMNEMGIGAAKEDCERPIRRRRAIILATVVPPITICCAIGVIVGIVKQRRRLLRRKRFDDRVRLLQDDCVDFRFLVFLSFSSEDDKFTIKHVLTPL